MDKASSSQARVSLRATFIENLEPRRLLSAGVPQAVLDQGYQPIQWHGQQAYAKPGQWMLKMNDVSGSQEAQLKGINKLLGGLGQGLKADRHLGADGLVRLQGPKDAAIDKLKGVLKKLDRFGYIEPDLAVWTSATFSNDSNGSSLWGLNNTGQTGGTPDADIDAPEAWDLARGNGSVVVGVIDSGVDYSHVDLSGNMWVNSRETAGNGVDDDGNGYVDDIHGWDFFNNDSNPADDNGHGTHVAGTIAATGNNGTGVTGVNWNAKVMALKFLGADGSGSLSAAIGAINYATKMKSQLGVNVQVTNNSWSGGGFSSTLYDAIKRSGDAGMLFVAAAGNGGADGVGDNNDLAASYPANYDLPNVISVAASDHNDVLASFSNYGQATVDLAAPGVSILSTTPGGGYGYSSGTSMAAPHVSGVAALAWSYRQGATANDIRSVLLNGTDAKGSLSGKVASGGRLNAHNSLQLLGASYSAPAAPSALTAAPASSSQIDLAWADNSTNEAGFRVYRSIDGVSFTEIASLGAGSTRFSNTGLSSATTYSYQIVAFNQYGTSAGSNVANATTASQASVPAAPSTLSASAVSRSQVDLRWQDNSGDESGFRIERSTDGSRWSQIATVGANTASYRDAGQKRNATYYYRVRAYNAVGVSSYSNTASTKTFAGSLSLLSTSGTSPFSAEPISGSSASDDDFGVMDLVRV
ncbi:MAG TPA: S8 family serine peptidase [Tepidisphaeraceae bacterium]